MATDLRARQVSEVRIAQEKQLLRAMMRGCEPSSTRSSVEPERSEAEHDDEASIGPLRPRLGCVHWMFPLVLTAGVSLPL